jgi:hypothetical protein
LGVLAARRHTNLNEPHHAGFGVDARTMSGHFFSLLHQIDQVQQSRKKQPCTLEDAQLSTMMNILHKV